MAGARENAGPTVALIGLVALIAAQAAPPREEPNTRFVAVDVFVDSGSTPLAAYQFELSAARGSIEIVGVEGGEHAAFSSPPYYDPQALAKNRIVIAAFNTGRDAPLPTGKTRVARVHLRVSGDTGPEYAVQLEVAADRDGRTIDASAQVERSANSR